MFATQREIDAGQDLWDFHGFERRHYVFNVLRKRITFLVVNYIMLHY